MSSRLGIALGSIGIAAAAWWALAPLGPVGVDVPGSTEIGFVSSSPRSSFASLDLVAFRAPLWVTPPPPPPPLLPERRPPPLAPFRLTLLAIVLEGDGKYAALFYDPDADRLIAAREGQVLGPRTVESVAADTIRLRAIDGGALSIALRGPSPQEGAPP